MECKALGKETVYFGESSRSWWDRAAEHSAALRSKDSKYAIVKHWEDDHRDKDDPPGFDFKALRSHKSSIERQISEAILIEANRDKPGVKILNSKAEWGLNKLPRMRILLDDEVTIPHTEPSPHKHIQGKRKSALEPNIHPETQMQANDINSFSEQFSQRKKLRRMANQQAQVGPETQIESSSQVSQCESSNREDQLTNSFRGRGNVKTSLLDEAMKKGHEAQIQSSSEGRKKSTSPQD